MVSIYRVKNIILLYTRTSIRTRERGRCGIAAAAETAVTACAFFFIIYFWASGRARTRVLYLYYYIIVNSRGGRAASAVLRGTFNSRPAAN